MDIMDNMLLKISDFVSSFRAPPIIFASLHKKRTTNKPRPLLALSFQESGSYKSYNIGKLKINHPVNHIAISSCHFGADSHAPSSDYRRWVITIDLSERNYFEEIKREPFFISKPVTNPENVIQSFQKVISNYPAINDATALSLKASYLELLSVVINETRSEKYHNKAFSSEIRDALRFINTNFNRPDIRLQNIAASCHLSKRQLDRKFKKELSTTPIKYLRRRRVEHAKYLLANSSLRVGEIALESGYPDPLHFSRIFNQEYGKSPLGFRKSENQST